MAMEEPPQVHFVVKSFEVSGANPLSDRKTDAVLDQFKGDHYGLEGLQTAAEALEAELRESGFAFYRVTLVPQELKDGIIKLEITEFKITNIVVEGNSHYSDANILNNAPTLGIDTTPNTDVLSRAINMANTKPSKHIKLQFAESETGGSIDAKLKVEDDEPDFFFVGLNNTGTDETGEFRLTGGYQFTNLFDRDHSLSLSYTTSPDEASAVGQYGISYSMPFYESGAYLDVLLAYSDVDSGIVAEQFDVSGKGTVFSLRYRKLFLQQGSYKQELEVGLDHKKFENDVIFSGFLPLGADVVSRPLSMTYKGSMLSKTSNLGFSIGAFSNISGGSLNEDTDYAANRVGIDSSGSLVNAGADWTLFRYSFGYTGFFAQNWLYRLNILGQETSDMLISGEQFGLGGMNSIRGFTERNVLGDTGYQASLELWFPPLSEHNIRTLVFYDTGHTETIDPLPGTPAEEDPASYGAGMRWSWHDRLTTRLDIGRVSKAAGTTEKGDSRAHLEVFYRF